MFNNMGKKINKEIKPEKEIKEKIDEDLNKLVTEINKIENEVIEKEEVKEEEKISKREELINASEKSFINQKVDYLKKCSNKIIDKIYLAYQLKRKKESDEFLTDLFISQFASTLGGLDAIEDPKNLTDELSKNPILKSDIENIISNISPFIPLIGLFGGIAITGKHIYNHKFNSKELTPIDNKKKIF